MDGPGRSASRSSHRRGRRRISALPLSGDAEASTPEIVVAPSYHLQSRASRFARLLFHRRWASAWSARLAMRASAPRAAGVQKRQGSAARISTLRIAREFVSAPNGARNIRQAVPDSRQIGCLPAAAATDPCVERKHQPVRRSPVGGFRSELAGSAAYVIMGTVSTNHRHASITTCARTDPLIILHAPCVSPPATTMLISDGSKIRMSSSGCARRRDAYGSTPAAARGRIRY